MYNLIQIQDAIKTVPLKDVMDYANGKNPQVPSYLALSELNRRKQLQDTSEAFYGEPGTLKEQIESSLTQAPQGTDITQAPPGQIDITKLPPQFAPNLPPVGQTQPGAAPQGQINPTAAPVMAARGGMMRSPDIARGLASIPVSQFKRSNFAGGGIVAFADTPAPGRTVGEAAEESWMERFFGDKRRPLYRDPVTGEGPPPVTPEQAAETERMRSYNPFKAAYETVADALYLRGEGSLQERIRARKEAEAAAEKDKKLQLQAETQDKQEGSEPVSKPTPNQQASATTSGQIKPPAAPTGIQTVTPTAPARQSVADRLGTGIPTEDETRAAIDRQKMLMREFGVSQDPYADIRKRYGDIEKRREERRAEEPTDRLMATLAAFSKAAPEKGFGYQMGVAGEARAAIVKEQEALKDKQDTEMAALYSSMAKEDDARKRGDMKAVESELAAQKAHKAKIIELENQSMQAQAAMVNAQAHQQTAARGFQTPVEIQLVERIAKEKGISFTDAYEYLQSAKGLEALKRQADKEWNDSMALRMEWEKKGGYQAYMASKGIATPGGAPQGAGPKEGDKATSKSGKPIIFRNGKWEYQ